jgi:hypothetical protein
VSSWAFWGGLLSNATEIHVNAPPHHAVMYGMNQYIYHNEKTNEYFGSYNAKLNDIIYRTNLTNFHHAKLSKKAIAHIINTHSNMTTADPVYIEVKGDHNHSVTPPAAVFSLDSTVLSPDSSVVGVGHFSSSVSTPEVPLPILGDAAPSVVSQTNVGVAGPNKNKNGDMEEAGSDNGKKLPIVYVFTVVPAICPYGLPTYIRTAIEQGIFTQPDCEVILVSNFGECTTVRDSVKDIKQLRLIDSTLITSNRTRQFKNASSAIFMTDGQGELWMTSALRFFMMEDMMLTFGFRYGSSFVYCFQGRTTNVISVFISFLVDNPCLFFHFLKSVS